MTQAPRIKNKDSRGLLLWEALSIFKNYNYSITTPGIIYLGNRNKFIKKIGKHLYFNKEKINKYLSLIKNPPTGWITITSLAKKYKIPRQNIYYWINKNELKTNIYTRRNILYAQEKDFKKCYEKYKRYHNK